MAYLKLLRIGRGKVLLSIFARINKYDARADKRRSGYEGFSLDFAALWDGLFWPLIRLIFFISIGLMIGNLIEALNWTRAMAKVASPLVRFGRLSDISGASFSMAFFSGVSANTMLAEAHEQGKLTDRELVISNLFNSLPTYFLHLPTLFFIIVPFIKAAAFVYVGLTVTSAFLRTGFILVVGRIFLPRREEECVVCLLEDNKGAGFRGAIGKTLTRFRKRLPKIVYITVPIYTLFFLLGRMGFFKWLQEAMAGNISFLSWLNPEALSIVVFHVAAEFTAGIAAAGALLEGGTLTVREVVLALLLGNILSSPMRAVRHQFPYYAGIFRPKAAMKLIVFNQALRIGSLILVGTAYFIITM